MTAYMKELKSEFILNNDQQVQLIEEYKQTNDEKILNKLIIGSIKFIYAIAKKYKCSSIDFDILLSAGCQGFTVAIDKFDVKKGNKFLTYAGHWIKAKIRDEVFHTQSIVSMSRATWTRKNRVHQLYNKGKSISEIAKICNYSEIIVKKLLNYKISYSLDQNHYEGSTNTYSDIIGNNDSEYTEDLTDCLLKLLDSLSEIKATIIKMRFGIGYDRIYTYKEIGTYVNRSHERIRQIQNDILKEFKNKLGEDNG